MTTRDRIPDIVPNRQFPIGDICDKHKQAKADDWLDKVAKQSIKQFSTMVNFSGRFSPTMITDSASKTHNEALALCRSWDGVENPDGTRDFFNYSQLGFRSMLAFNNETQYLPFCTVDFSEELRQMRRPQESLYRAREFGHAVWMGLQHYANVQKTLEALMEEAKQKTDLIPDDNRDLFRAGIALAYMLSMTSRLVGYTPPFTSFRGRDATGKSINLTSEDFHKFFFDD